MKVSKLIMAWLAGFVAMLLLSGLWYEILMPNVYSAQFATIERTAPLYTLVVIGYLMGTFLLAYIYPIGYKGKAPIVEGVKFGVLMGLVIAFPAGLVLYGAHMVPISVTLLDVLYQVVEKIIGGIIIGLIYGTSVTAETK